MDTVSFIREDSSRWTLAVDRAGRLALSDDSDPGRVYSAIRVVESSRMPQGLRDDVAAAIRRILYIRRLRRDESLRGRAGFSS